MILLLTTFLFHHWLQKIMKRLIKRYIIKARADRESDEITEGSISRMILKLKTCFNGYSITIFQEQCY